MQIKQFITITCYILVRNTKFCVASLTFVKPCYGGILRDLTIDDNTQILIGIYSIQRFFTD